MKIFLIITIIIELHNISLNKYNSEKYQLLKPDYIENKEKAKNKDIKKQMINNDYNNNFFQENNNIKKLNSIDLVNIKSDLIDKSKSRTPFKKNYQESHSQILLNKYNSNQSMNELNYYEEFEKKKN